MASTAREDLYTRITARLIGELESGVSPWVQPWVQPWGDAAAPLGLPRNAATGRRYSGINIPLLCSAVMDQDFPAQLWLTFRQALALGGNVRKGEHGTMVVFADQFVPEREKARVGSSGAEPVRIPFLKRFTVFNVAQCEGAPSRDRRRSGDVSKVSPRLDLILPRVGAYRSKRSQLDLRPGARTLDFHHMNCVRADLFSPGVPLWRRCLYSAALTRANYWHRLPHVWKDLPTIEKMAQT